MSGNESPIPRPSMRVVDVSGTLEKSLAKVSQLSDFTSAAKHNVAAIIADGNNLFTLQGVHLYPGLIQLSVRDNSLVRMGSVAALTKLVTLNLQNNSLTEIAGLGSLPNLQWLCLSGNSIKALSGLAGSIHLNHLDLSDNCITELTDISMLRVLKTLLLHGNAISLLSKADVYLPSSLETLSLAENEVEDLTQVSSLASLRLLTQLSLMNNPCVSITDTQMFDSRPYVLYCCPHLTMLDGVQVSPQERNLTASLFPPNQPHPFSVGQHDLLVDYLGSISPLSSSQMFVSTNMGYSDNQENMDPNEISTLSSATFSSTSGLEEMIKGAHSSNNTDMLRKLKALQLIEQMICTREESLGGCHGNGRKAEQYSPLSLPKEIRDCSLPPAPNYTRFMEPSPHQLTRPPVVLADDAHLGSVNVSSSGDTFAVSESSEDAAAQKVKVGAHLTHPKAVGGRGCGQQPAKKALERPRDSLEGEQLHLEEKKREQLRLLNKKIVQRHSKLPHKREPADKTLSTPSSSGVVAKKAVPGAQREDSSKAKRTNATSRSSTKDKSGLRKLKGTSKQTKKDISSSKSAPSLRSSKSTSSTVPPSHSRASNKLHASPPSRPKMKKQPVTSLQAAPPPQWTIEDTSKLLSTSDVHLVTTTSDGLDLDPASSSMMVTIEDDTISANDSDLLDSTSCLLDSASCLIPSDGDETLLAADDGVDDLIHSSLTLEKDPKEEDLPDDVDSLASSLTRAYGLTVNSDLLSTLSSPPAKGVERESTSFKVTGHFTHSARTPNKGSLSAHKAATIIQTAWRSFCNKERKPAVENTGKDSGLLASVCAQLEGCREKLTHQASVVQVQEETIQSLRREVESLLEWKVRWEAKERHQAAITIQRHWRGYRDRKRYPRINHGLVRPSLVGMWALCHSLMKQVEEMSLALSSVQDVCGTREKLSNTGFLKAQLPQAKDLHMTHFSSTCVLLHWTPPPPADVTGVSLQGYRVYVNGVPEGTVGEAKSKAYIEGLDPKTTYRITVRAVYNVGESCDSNPIAASLDGCRRGEEKECGETAQEVGRPSSKERSAVNGEQSREINSDAISEHLVDAKDCVSDGVHGETVQDCVSAIADGGETEEQVQSGFLPCDAPRSSNNNGPQAQLSLSSSTTLELGNGKASGAVTLCSPGSETEPQTPLQNVTEHSVAGTEGHVSAAVRENSVENDFGAQDPPDFESTHLFRLVPKAHHITDETVSVMSNFTEEYLGGSSSRDTMTHEPSLTSMIFGGRESGRTSSDSSPLDSGSGSSESGDVESNKVDQIEQIQKSYLSQLPPHSSHGGERDTPLHYSQVMDIPRQSHDSTVNGGIPLAPSASANVNVDNVGNTNLLLYSPPTSSTSMPHLSLVPFDSASSKNIPLPLHPLSNVLLHGELQGLTMTGTTATTFEPVRLTSALGNTLPADTDTHVVLAERNKGSLKEANISAVAMVDYSNASRLQPHGASKSGSKCATLCSPESVSGQLSRCQVSVEQEAVNHITSETVGSQTTPEAFRVAKATKLNPRALPGSAVQILPTEVADTSVQDCEVHQERACEATKRDRDVGGKPCDDEGEPDPSSPCVREDSKESNGGMKNKSDPELPVERAGVMVKLPSQLPEGFDQLQACEKVPSVASEPNLLSGTKEMKTSQVTTCAQPLASTSQPLANKPQTLVSEHVQGGSTPAQSLEHTTTLVDDT